MRSPQSSRTPKRIRKRKSRAGGRARSPRTRPETVIPCSGRTRFAVSSAFPAVGEGSVRRIRGLGRAAEASKPPSWKDAIAPAGPPRETRPEAAIPCTQTPATPRNASGSVNPERRAPNRRFRTRHWRPSSPRREKSRRICYPRTFPVSPPLQGHSWQARRSGASRIIRAHTYRHLMQVARTRVPAQIRQTAGP